MSQDGDGFQVPDFDRSFFESKETFSRIGGGSLGGKAQGLISIKGALEGAFPGGLFGPVRVGIPRLAVLGTDAFVDFMERNRLYDVALSGEADRPNCPSLSKGRPSLRASR